MSYYDVYDNVIKQPELSEESSVVNAVSMQAYSGDQITGYSMLELIDVSSVINKIQNYNPIFQDETICKILIELLYGVVEIEDYHIEITEALPSLNQTLYQHTSFRSGGTFDMDASNNKPFILYIMKMLEYLVPYDLLREGTFVGWRDKCIVIGIVNWHQ